MEGRSSSRLLALALGVACALACGEARADVDWQLAIGVSGGWLRRTPNLSTDRVATPARSIAPSELRMDRSLGLAAFVTDLTVTVDDRWSLPLLGVGIAAPVGGYGPTVTSLDGSIARVRPWTGMRVDLLLPGIGRRFKHRRTMWAVAVRGGYSAVSFEGSVADGTTSTALEPSAATFLVQLELEGCRRLDPNVRVCAQLTPRIYDHELMNGFMLGLRVEWGR